MSAANRRFISRPTFARAVTRSIIMNIISRSRQRTSSGSGVPSVFEVGVVHEAPLRGPRVNVAEAVRRVLTESIAVGGTTLRDFSDARGDPGYFQQTLMVYGREGEACKVCGATVRRVVSGNRSVFFCGHCQR